MRLNKFESRAIAAAMTRLKDRVLSAAARFFLKPTAIELQAPAFESAPVKDHCLLVDTTTEVQSLVRESAPAKDRPASIETSLNALDIADLKIIRTHLRKAYCDFGCSAVHIAESLTDDELLTLRRHTGSFLYKLDRELKYRRHPSCSKPLRKRRSHGE